MINHLFFSAYNQGHALYKSLLLQAAVFIFVLLMLVLSAADGLNNCMFLRLNQSKSYCATFES
jgi:hypothetical protein